MNLQVNSNLALELPSDLEFQQAPARTKSDPRASLAAQFIPYGANILDLGGNQSLQSLLPAGCHYRAIGKPGRKRAANIGDVASGDFPTDAALQSDIIVMLGVLERFADIETLFTHLRFCKRDIILSYSPTNLTGDTDRAAQGYINHLSFYELARLFDRYGFRIECTTPVDEVQVLMRITPTECLAPIAPCSVAVISGNNGEDFASRLGRHVLNSLLPGEAEVHHMTCDTLDAARECYDLVILGTGCGLFPPLLSEEIFDVLSRAKATIGIFGTQGRELVARAVFDRLVDRLDTWFARYEDDVLAFGRSRNNVVPIGDWLIDQFPLARPVHQEPLVINGDLGQESALDRAIATIQQHQQVYSTVPAALLCALTSAELAAFAEITTQQPDLAAGQFRSMLIDVFGRTFPQQKFFIVDRDAVARYKARVHQNVSKVGARIGAILRNVAVAA
jgi:hypothetical protein